ncbi:bifunctional serine/threonine protein kinase/MFS transporter [Streptomyces sp. NPDC051211]|uniref:bifunctional serine/threonine protein kinase/MFS transporter n=1 Tax=Streptomyces sp. NPDC051211 TaxID=3154643 RepID=UPI00344D4485
MDQLITEDPTRIGPYRLIARLGAGGMGLVYLGRSEGGRTVAVKVVQAEYAGNTDFRKRFAREVAAARRVGGSWTAAVLDADPEAAVPWVATQYIPGPDLHTVVAEDFGPLPEHSVHTLANRLALALQAVHEAGLIHRDLKPSNVLVTVDGPRVIDFGIARAMDSLTGDSLLTRTGTLIGSAGFMSPEQVRGLELTPASDVFCLGAVLVYAATGRLLFGAADTGLNAHLFRVAEEEADLTGVPESLVGLVRECLDKDPAKRPTPRQVAERTATDQAAEWLPGAVLAQLGRHAARLLDYAPATPARASAEESPAAQPDPRVPSARPEPRPQLPKQPLPPPPAYAPTAPAQFGPAQGFGPPPGPTPGAWPQPPPPAHPEGAVTPHPRRWWGLVVIALAQLLVLLDATTFNIAVASLHADLGLHGDDLEMMYRAHVLAFSGLLLLGGHLGDLVGRKAMLIVGLAGTALAATLAGSAGDLTVLIWARAAQGASAALLTSAALALVAAGFTDPRERGKAFGVYAAIAAAGPALGLLTGGWLLEFLSWRGALYVAVPVAVLALAGAAGLVHESPRARTGARFDPLGLALGTGASLALVHALTETDTRGWDDPLVLALLVVGVVLFAVFLWWHTRTTRRFATPDDVPARARLGSVLVMLLAGVGVVASFPTVPFFLQQVLGDPPSIVGVSMLPMTCAMVVGATQLSGRLLHRVGPRILTVAGLVVASGGLLLLTGLDVDSGYATGALPGMVLLGLGLGVAFVPVLATATAGVAPQRSGATSATVTVAQHLGGAIGGALLSGVIAAYLDGASVSSGSFAADLLGSYTTTLWWAAGSMLLAALVAGLMITAKAPGDSAPPAR